jgi:hypothetical protein
LSCTLCIFSGSDKTGKYTELSIYLKDLQKDRESDMMCHKYAIIINAKGAPFPTEPLIMALLLSQHKMIKWLSEEVSKYKN